MESLDFKVIFEVVGFIFVAGGTFAWAKYTIRDHHARITGVEDREKELRTEIMALKRSVEDLSKSFEFMRDDLKEIKSMFTLTLKQ